MSKTPPPYLLPAADHERLETMLVDAVDLLQLLQGFMVHLEGELIGAGGKHLTGIHPLLDVISDKVRTASDMIDSINLTKAEEVGHD